MAGSSLFPRHPPMRSLPSRERGTGFRVGKRSNGEDGDRDGLCPRASPSTRVASGTDSNLSTGSGEQLEEARAEQQVQEVVYDWPEHGDFRVAVCWWPSLFLDSVRVADMSGHDRCALHTAPGIRAITFGATFLRIEGLSRWTAQRPIRL